MIMKTVSRFICVLVAIVMALSFSAETFAVVISTSDGVPQVVKRFMLENFAPTLELMLDDENKGMGMQNFIILNPVSFNVIENIDEKSDLSVIHFPVAKHSSGEVCFIYDVITDGDNCWATIGEDFAPLLNAVIAENSTDVLLVQEDFALYAVTSNSTLCQTNMGVNRVSFESSEELIASVGFDNMHVSRLGINNEFSDIAEKSFSKRQQGEVNGCITALRGKKRLENYPIVPQGSYDLCWAAAIATMVMYEMPDRYNQLTAKEVADDNGMEYKGANIYDCLNVVKHYFKEPYYDPSLRYSVLTPEEIKTIIDNDDPAFCEASRPVGSGIYAYHAVAMMGYEYTSEVTAIEIVDSQYLERSKFCTYDSTGNWTFYGTKFTYGDIIYTWISAITIDAY